MAQSASPISVGPETVPPRAQHPVTVTLAQQTGLAVRVLDRDIAAAEGLGKLLVEKPSQLGHAHFRNCHAFPALASGHPFH
jgi:hypothetical protein